MAKYAAFDPILSFALPNSLAQAIQSSASLVKSWRWSGMQRSRQRSPRRRKRSSYCLLWQHCQLWLCCCRCRCRLAVFGTHTCTHTHTHICMHIRTLCPVRHVLVYLLSAQAVTYLWVYVCACMCVFICSCVFLCAYACVCACVYF